MDVIPVSKFFIYVIVGGIILWFTQGVLVYLFTLLQLNNPYANLILFIVTDGAYITILLAAAIRLFMVSQKRGGLYQQ